MLRRWRPVLCCAWLIWACAAAARAAEPVPPRYPVEAFARLPYLEAAVLSPNGVRLAARAPVGGRHVLIIRSLVEKDAKPAIVQVPGASELLWYRWTSDDFL